MKIWNYHKMEIMRIVKKYKCEVVVLMMWLSFWLSQQTLGLTALSLTPSVMVPPLHVERSSSGHSGGWIWSHKATKSCSRESHKQTLILYYIIDYTSWGHINLSCREVYEGFSYEKPLWGVPPLPPPSPPPKRQNVAFLMVFLRSRKNMKKYPRFCLNLS
jgi:hypothetical protein